MLHRALESDSPIGIPLHKLDWPSNKRLRASYWYDGEQRSTDLDCVEVELENTALTSDRAVVSTQPQDNFDSRLEYIHIGTFSLLQQQHIDLSCVSSAEG